MTWVQLCTTERRPSLLMDAQQSSIIKATRYVFQQTWQPTIDNLQLTTDKQQPTTDNWQPTTGQGVAGITWWAKGVIWPPGVGQIFLLLNSISLNWWHSMFMFQQFPAISRNCDSSTSAQRHLCKSVIQGQFVQRRPWCWFCGLSFTLLTFSVIWNV